MKSIRQLITIFVCLCAIVSLCVKPSIIDVHAENSSYVESVSLDTRSSVFIDRCFGEYQCLVDENIYYSLSSVNSNTLVQLYGNHDTPMFNMAKETINPCMALATTWGEAGSSHAGISLTTVMDFNPDTYKREIDWITLTANIEQVDSSWYIANVRNNYNTCVDGRAYLMPNALLQVPIGGGRQTSPMTGLGVGPYQITSSDWDRWSLDNRVNPVWGFKDSLRKTGTSWIDCGITPISDLTVYACLSLGHQGGGLIDYDFGKELVSIINKPDIQDAFNRVGFQMYEDAREKSYSRSISLSDVNVAYYVPILEGLTGVDFSDYTGGAGRTNKGNYVVTHCLRYVFYKYYFTGGY